MSRIKESKPKYIARRAEATVLRPFHSPLFTQEPRRGVLGKSPV